MSIILDFFLSRPYVKWIIILVLFYIIVYTVGYPFNRFDFILVTYIIALDEINEDNALQFSILFGLFYDLHNQIFLGVGILLFQLINFAKVQMDVNVDMSKMYTKLIFIVSVLAVYLALTLKFFGYSSSIFLNRFAYYFVANIFVIVLISILKEGKRAFSRS